MKLRSLLVNSLTLLHLLMTLCFGKSPIDNVDEIQLSKPYLSLYNTTFNSSYHNITDLNNHANKGDATAQAILSDLYRFGMGNFSSDKKADYWAKRSAKQGFWYGEFLVEKYGWGLENAFCVDYCPNKKIDRLFPRLERLANHNNAVAADCLGWLYRSGIRGLDNYHRATYWFKRASELGNPHSLYHLGLSYETGWWDLPQNPEMAFKHYFKSAQLGHLYAKERLGILYHEGIGTQRDDEKAKHWLSQSSFSGNPEVKNRLLDLTNPQLYLKQKLAPARQIIDCVKENFKEFDPTNQSIVFISHRNKLVYKTEFSAMFNSKLKFIRVEYSELPMELKSKMFSIVEANEKVLIGIAYDKFYDQPTVVLKQLFSLSYEGYLKNKLEVLNTKSIQSKNYPSNVILYQEQILELLISELKNSDPKNLPEVAFWYSKLKKDFASFSDTIIKNSLIEGNVAFMAQLYDSVFELGCKASKDIIYKSLKAKITSNQFWIQQIDKPKAIGIVAGTLLRRYDHLKSIENTYVSSEKSLLESLLKGIEPVNLVVPKEKFEKSINDGLPVPKLIIDAYPLDGYYEDRSIGLIRLD